MYMYSIDCHITDNLSTFYTHKYLLFKLSGDKDIDNICVIIIHWNITKRLKSTLLRKR